MTLTRPRTIAEMQCVDQAFVSTTGLRRGLGYTPGASDIFISPYAKCGTTWMQQIVHGLRSGGSMDFDEITEVVPWLELAHDMGVDVNAPQVAAPRAFKSHLGWDDIPKGGQYIVVLRDPVDAMVSLYNFLDGWRFEAGAISLDDFAAYYLDRAESNNYWTHAASWWRQRDRPEVLLLAFEQMKGDLPRAVNLVADFMHLPDDPELRQLATRQAGFEFMKEHGRQFDDHLLRAARDEPCGLPPGGKATKVASGKVGTGKPLVTEKIRAEFNTRWHEEMTREFGLDSYAALLRALASGNA
ncbi:sulfotransferase domain-containing protein [uncultured Roseovarius sp.]|uniref:sulfotransferase domain-containing protein n=1 Tax=uncultured Roseovarius sp. TaxID=293344 RepID=UPI0026298F50|nr:sulfotransferase domain-containing protein [uncultured Roseovarius sp.]